MILGGTTEATALGQALAEAGIAATISLAGRVARPKRQPLAMRIGGFGGAVGLARYLADNQIAGVIDATHPFATGMSRNAVEAAKMTGTPLVAFTRPPWHPQEGDKWCEVADIDGAVAALKGPPKRILLAVGRMHLGAFAANPQHHYVLRLVDPPQGPLPSADAKVILDRGPFDEDSDLALLQDHQIDFVVSKNSGGTAAYAKIAAARRLGLPVLMIQRPAQPARDELTELSDVMAWIEKLRHSADLGV